MDLRCFQKIYKESRILFLRFRRKSTKPSKGLDFVANLETFFKFRSMYETIFKFRSTHETIFGLKRFRMEPFFFSVWTVESKNYSVFKPSKNSSHRSWWKMSKRRNTVFNNQCNFEH